MSRDPIEELDALGLFLFVSNNPINNFDKDGRLTICQPIATLPWGKDVERIEGTPLWTSWFLHATQTEGGQFPIPFLTVQCHCMKVLGRVDQLLHYKKRLKIEICFNIDRCRGIGKPWIRSTTSRKLEKRTEDEVFLDHDSKTMPGGYAMNDSAANLKCIGICGGLNN